MIISLHHFQWDVTVYKQPQLFLFLLWSQFIYFLFTCFLFYFENVHVSLPFPHLSFFPPVSDPLVSVCVCVVFVLPHVFVSLVCLPPWCHPVLLTSVYPWYVSIFCSLLFSLIRTLLLPFWSLLHLLPIMMFFDYLISWFVESFSFNYQSFWVLTLFPLLSTHCLCSFYLNLVSICWILVGFSMHL